MTEIIIVAVLCLLLGNVVGFVIGVLWLAGQKRMPNFVPKAFHHPDNVTYPDHPEDYELGN